MLRSLLLAALVVSGVPDVALTLGSTAVPAQAQNADSSNSPSKEIPRDFVPQNAPCADQPRSFKELDSSFKNGRRPLASEMTGTWVEIGDLNDPPGEVHSLNCSGEKRGPVFEFVLVANGYSLELHAVGMIAPQKVRMKSDNEGGVEFREVDFGGEGTLDDYHCRLTQRGTPACLIGKFTAVEFKKMSVEKSQIYEPEPPRGWSVNSPRD